MDNIVLSIVSTILYPEYAKDPAHFQVTHTAEVLYRKIKAMPLLLRIAMMMAVHVFNFSGIFVSACFFEHQDLITRQKQIKIWQDSKIGVCNDVVAFFNKMTLFIYFSICQKRN